MKRQIFLDGNKRASILFVNHYLIAHGQGYFSTADRTEWFPVGIYNYNVSRLIKDVSNYDCLSDEPDTLPDGVHRCSVSVKEISELMCGYGEFRLQDEHVEAADMEHPILLDEVSPDIYDLVDGHHRMEKARRHGVDQLDAYIIPADTAI